MGPRFPNFIGIGAQKGGTTTLHAWLKTHPEAYLPNEKEIHFFDQNFEKGNVWYQNKFKDAKKQQICGEITPYYLYHPKAATRINITIPNCKLIVMLRDPVERTISQLLHSQKRGFEPLTMEDALNAEKDRLASNSETSLQKHSYVSRSKYLSQLTAYERYWHQEQILILKSEDVFENTLQNWIKIQEFLGIKVLPLADHPIPTENRNTQARDNDEFKSIRKRLRSELSKEAWLIKKKYGISWEWQ
ncbi:sulfotransferase domain-containing protein [Synechococcus sp. AH-551-A10]|nr:sulfotransferase domain-containing protein [Synechococcus sp. AH-551-A10]MDB4682135.1 sulfotransferase domain-containing protein [Synechococcus sp. AH-551-A10]